MKAEFARNPGVPLLEQLSKPDQLSLALFTHEIEIGLGCSGRPCRMCCYSAPEDQGSIPFSTIQQFHRTKKELSPRTKIRHFRANDVVYYSWTEPDGAVKDYSDVFIDAYENGIALDDILTHGWLADEEHPRAAAAKLVAFAKRKNLPPFMALSVDPYGYIGVGKEEQIAGIKSTLATIEPVCKTIYAYYNPDSQSEGNLKETQELVAQTIPRHLHSKVVYEMIYDLGRGSKFSSAPVPNSDLPGYSIRFNGDVFFTVEHGAKSKKIGNIYRSLPRPLPTPIPRAPDFD